MGSDPDILVDLTTAKSDFEAQVIVESLRAQGIPAQAFTTVGMALPLDLGSTRPCRIAVRRRDLAAAGSALRAIRAESVDIDWDEVDVGDPVPAGVRDGGTCMRCGYDVMGLTDPFTCPECGANLKDVGSAGTARHSRAFMGAVGLVLVVLGVIAYILYRSSSLERFGWVP